MGADDPVPAVLDQGEHRLIAHAAGGFAVPGGGGAAPLDVAQHGHPGVDAYLLVDPPADVDGAARALSYHHHIVGRAGQAGPADLFHHVVFKVYFTLWNEDCGGSHCDAHIQGEVTGVAAHHLHHRAALMGLHGVPQLVNALHSGIAGGVESNGIV